MSPWLRRPNGSAFVLLTPLERCVVLVVLFFLAIFPLAFVVSEVSGTRLILYFSFLLYLALLALPFSIRSYRPSLFHPVCFYVLWFSIQGLVRGGAILPISGLEYHRALGFISDTASDSILTLSFLLDSIGLICLYIGYSLIPKIVMQPLALPKPRFLLLKANMWVALSVLGLLALATIGGGLDQVLMQRGLASDQRIAAEVGGHWGFLAGVGVLAPVIWLACDSESIKRSAFWVVLVVALAVKFASTGSRGGTIMPLLMVGAVYILQRHTIPYRAVVIGVFVALIMVGAGGQFRKATMQSSSLEEVTLESGVSGWIISAIEEMQGQVGSSSGQLAVLGAVPSEEPYLFGESYLSVPYIFLPSAIFGDKPEAGGRLLSTRIYGNSLNTIPPQSVGEAFWNFSYLGVVVVFLLHGMALKLLAGFYSSNPTHPLVIVLFVYFLFRFQLNSDSLYSLAHSVIPAVFIYSTFLFFNFKRQRGFSD